MRKIILFALIIFTGCHSVDNGTVVSKDINPAYSTIIMMPLTICSGKGGCTTTFTTIPVFYPKSYSIRIRGLNKNGEVKESTFYVSKSAYDTIRLNSFQCFNDGCKERPYVEQ